ncbi:MAG: hypothetical protein KC983_08215, partial [Phycisphaerales bacterium]|nr:hypothetical protein [Phycisphaerales bacterium]
SEEDLRMKQTFIGFALGVGICVLAAPSSRGVTEGPLSLSPACPAAFEPTIATAYIAPLQGDGTNKHYRLWTDGHWEIAKTYDDGTVVMDWTPLQ